MAAIERNMLVSEIVLDHPECARVFSAHHIDFCCGGRVSLASVCAEKKIDCQRMLDELARATERSIAGQDVDFRLLSTPSLVAYIISQHHEYLRRSLPETEAMAAKVGRVHGQQAGDLVELAKVVEGLGKTLRSHLEHEERVLFPALMSAGDGPLSEPIREELASMGRDHLDVALALERIRVLTDGFTVPEWGCVTYRALFATLRALEEDIHRHVHLENDILMPRFMPDASKRRSLKVVTSS